MKHASFIMRNAGKTSEKYTINSDSAFLKLAFNST